MHNAACFFVRENHQAAGFVRNVEKTLFTNPFAVNIFYQCRGKLVQKCTVFFSGGARFPTEYLLGFAVYIRYDFRCMLCAPLGKQMAHFVVFYAAAVAHRKPTVEFFKPESILIFAGHFHIDQLHGRAFFADLCVKRRGKQRRENTVHAVFVGALQKAFRNTPVLLRKNRNFVVFH